MKEREKTDRVREGREETAREKETILMTTHGYIHVMGGRHVFIHY